MAYSLDKNNMSPLEEKKKTLIQSLKKGGIHNETLLDAIKKVPREEFIPNSMRNFAYDDFPLEIGYNQTISAPSIVAYMINVARLKKSDHVLEIGTGSGYQTALLSMLSHSVESIEIIPELAKKAKDTLNKLGFSRDNKIIFHLGSGFRTHLEKEHFDAIIVSAAPEDVPEHLKDLLKTGGRLVIPTGKKHGVQRLLKITKKTPNTFLEEELLSVRFVPMVEKITDGD